MATDKSCSLSPNTRRILLPIDGSEHSKRAVNWYLKEFYRSDDLVYFIHIVEPHFSKTSIESIETGKDVSVELDKNIEHYVELGKIVGDELQKELQKAGIKINYSMQIGSKPGEVIVSTAREQSVDVIIIGNRGVGYLRRTFLGSVSEYVLHHSNIAVIVIPPNSV